MSAPTFAVSIHDVAPATWPACQRLLKIVETVAAPATLLVVPRYHGGCAVDEAAGFADAMRDRVARGDEISLHGYLHRDDARMPRTPLEWARRRWYTASEGEFDALDESTADLRLGDGLARLARMGLPVRSFVAPAWLLGAGGRQALTRTSLEFTSTRDWLIRVQDGQRMSAPSLVWSARSALRRAVSLRWNGRRAARLADAPLLRVAMHPADAEHTSVLAAWTAVLAELAASRTPTLEFDAAARALPAPREPARV